MEPESTSPPWGVNLSIAIGVLGTVFVALLLAQLDTLRARLPLPATVIALVTQPILTETTVPTTPLPTVTPTLFPPSPAPTAISSPGVTAVPMLPVCGEVPAGWVPYIVQPGDSYFFLSANSGATITEIIQANCLDPNVLLSGIQIYLPAQPPIRPVCGPPTTWVRYTVQRGDTLFSLAQQRGTTVYAVMQANCLSSSYLQAERQIYLPPLPATITPSPTLVPPPTDEPSTAVPPTPTWTAVPPTAAPSATATVTPQPSPTATIAASVTPGTTPTPSPVIPTVTMTATPTLSPTPTNTPSVTATPTASNTPIPSPTSTELPSPTNTATPQPTATSTDTPTPSPASGS